MVVLEQDHLRADGEPDQVGTTVEEPVAVVDEPAVEPRREKRSTPKKKPRRQPPYHVVLWNDDDHTHAYVIAMLQKLFGHPPEKGYQLACEVDARGRAIVLTTTREHAELKRDQIHAYGKDGLVADCAGSMWSTIEPAEGG
ncbi:MAG: ATP-dependent Clp protease adaptor ClpS [Pirellulales bacterium]|nr:ATP-dependent Clp protease adaptor ClpS [Pirellulales bacterium]